MFDVSNLVLWAAIVFCSASLIKAVPVETTSDKTAATCQNCGKALENCVTKCTCQESDANATSHDIRVRSVPEPQSQHHIFKRVRRCVGMEFLGAENALLPPESVNQKLREEIEKRLAEIKSRVEALRSLSFLGSKRAKADDVKEPATVADSASALGAADTAKAQATVAAAADQTAVGPDENTLQSAANTILAGRD